MDAIVYHFPVKTPQPAPWNAGNTTVIRIAAALHSRGVTPAQASGAAASFPEYGPVAEALLRLETAEDVADVTRDMIRAASRR